MRSRVLLPIIALGALASAAPVVAVDDVSDPAARHSPKPTSPAARTPKALTAADEERIALAQAKRARKAAKLAQELKQ